MKKISIIILAFWFFFNGDNLIFAVEKLVSVDIDGTTATITANINGVNEIYIYEKKINSWELFNDENIKLDEENKFYDINKPGLFYIVLGNIESTGQGTTITQIDKTMNILWEQSIYIPSPSPSDHSELAKKYAPIVVFHQDEQYFPQNLDDILDYKAGEKSIYIQTLIENKPYKMGTELKEFMQYNGHSNYSFNSATFLKDSKGSKDNITIYYEFSQEDEKTYLTYHFFYAFDPKAGKVSNVFAAHPFDRESFTITFDSAMRPEAITYAGHLADQTIKFLGCNDFENCAGAGTTKLLEWTGGKVQLTWNNALKLHTHPVVYLAKGAHAIYPSAGWYHPVFTDVSYIEAEPAGSLNEALTVYPKNYQLTQFDLNTQKYLAYSGSWVTFINGNKVRFPPFTGRSPYRFWTKDASNSFDDCLDNPESSTECEEVNKHFQTIYGIGNKGAIHGMVKDSSDNMPLANITITARKIEETAIETVTYLDGTFEFILDEGLYIFTFSAEDYEILEISNVEVKPRETVAFPSIVFLNRITGIVDLIPPTVISNSPFGTKTASIDSTITITFSESIDSSIVTDSTFTVSIIEGIMGGTITYIEGTLTHDETSITFSPSNNLDYDTTYTVKISSNVKDLAGNALEEDYIWTFTTELLLSSKVEFFPLKTSYLIGGIISRTLSGFTPNGTALLEVKKNGIITDDSIWNLDSLGDYFEEHTFSSDSEGNYTFRVQDITTGQWSNTLSYAVKNILNSSPLFSIYTMESIGTLRSDVHGMTVDLNNKVHVSACHDNDGSKLGYTTNASGSWITSIIDTETCYTPSIAVDSNANVHISYLDKNNHGLKYSTNISGAWSIFDIDNFNYTCSGMCVIGGSSSIIIDSNNYVHISYYDYGSRTIKYITNMSGSWVISTIQGNTSLTSSIAVNLNDNIYITYASGGSIKYATNTSGSWVISTVDSKGISPSIAIDSTNKVHISYYRYLIRKDISTYSPQYTTNLTGVWVTTEIDYFKLVNPYIDIDIDTFDNVHISYNHASGINIKYATNVSGSWIISTVNSEGKHNTNINIIVDSINNIHITYAENYTTLKYAYTQ